MHALFLNRLSLHRLHVVFETVRLTLSDRGIHKRIGLAPIPSISFPTIAITGTPTAAAICSGPESTLITAWAALQTLSSIKDVLPLNPVNSVCHY